MAYDPNAYKEKEVQPTVKATVSEIKEGILSEFVDEQSLAKWKNADPAAPAIHIIAETEDGVIRRRTISLPEENEIHPSSNLAAWKRAYGDYPHVGQAIELDADEQGWYQFRA